MESIIVSTISAIATIITVILNTRASSRDLSYKLETHQAVIDTKIDSLTSEVREHNNFARRMPVVEEKIESLERRMERIENSRKTC
jgi:polyhydroxyalkanoate synthesis regulator phasin